MSVLLTKIKNMIRQAYYSLVDTDSSTYPQGQATVNGKPTKFTRVSVYGVCSNPPTNAHVILLNSQGQDSVKFGILNDFINRKKGLKEGEVVLFNTMAGSFIHLKEDGSIDVEADGQVNITSPKVTMSGDLQVAGKISAAGDIIADYLSTAITMLTHYHLGNLGRNTTVGMVTGGSALPANNPTMDADGDVITGTDLTSLDDHTHPYTWTDPGGSGNTGAPN